MLLCSIALIYNIHGVDTAVKEDVLGRVVTEYRKQYLMDFSYGVKKFDISDYPWDYARVVVNKTDCVPAK